MLHPTHISHLQTTPTSKALASQPQRVVMFTRKGFVAAFCAALALGVFTTAHAADEGTTQMTPATSQAPVEADNTARNERDSNDATLTPTDQSNDAHDIVRSADIRKALVADESLSVNAQNIKVITVGGRVTLRGPVDSAAERTRIAEIAARVAGAANVTNEIELAAP